MNNGDLHKQSLPQGRHRSMVGLSSPMQKLYSQIQKASQGMYPVVIRGETGTGKELVARSIHCEGALRNRPFVPVDCPALQPALLESELFGHVRGAFTGATNTKMGLMATANGGTLFLDEIGDLPLNEQAKLLRVLQEKEVRPVGSNQIVPLNVRVISATNRDLETAVGNKTFRPDLFFRLNVLELYVPPLRDRRSDIPLLARYFLEKFCGTDVGGWTISAEAMECLTAHDWPGNVRELEHAIECAVAFCSNSTVEVDDIPSSIRRGTCKESVENDSVFNMKENKRRMIVLALGETRGDKVAAARILGIGKTTIYRLLKEDKELEARLAAQVFN